MVLGFGVVSGSLTFPFMPPPHSSCTVAAIWLMESQTQNWVKPVVCITLLLQQPQVGELLTSGSPGFLVTPIILIGPSSSRGAGWVWRGVCCGGGGLWDLGDGAWWWLLCFSCDIESLWWNGSDSEGSGYWTGSKFFLWNQEKENQALCPRTRLPLPPRVELLGQFTAQLFG